MDLQARQLIAAFEQDDRGYRFFSDFAEAIASDDVADRACEMMLERRA